MKINLKLNLNYDTYAINIILFIIINIQISMSSIFLG